MSLAEGPRIIALLLRAAELLVASCRREGSLLAAPLEELRLPRMAGLSDSLQSSCLPPVATAGRYAEMREGRGMRPAGF